MFEAALDNNKLTFILLHPQFWLWVMILAALFISYLLFLIHIAFSTTATTKTTDFGLFYIKKLAVATDIYGETNNCRSIVFWFIPVLVRSLVASRTFSV